MVLFWGPGWECLATLPCEVLSERALTESQTGMPVFSCIFFLSLTLWLPSSWDAVQDECGCLQFLLAICCEEGKDCIPS